MKENNQILKRCGKAVAKMSLAVGNDSATRSICSWWFYQPKVPNAMQKTKSDK